MRAALPAAVLLASSLAATSCRALGFTDRVLCRVPSPDARFVAVCQEIPAFDGPGYDVRLERPDGTIVRRLYTIGDGDGCSEIAWSSDGNVLAVLTAHVARVRVVDVAWALRQPPDSTRYWSWRQMDFSSERDLRMARELRFTAPQEIELAVCRYSLQERRRTGVTSCLEPERRERHRIPLPIAITGR